MNNKHASYCYFAKVVKNFDKNYPNQILVQALTFPSSENDVDGQVWLPYLSSVVGVTPKDKQDKPGYGFHSLPEDGSIVVVLALDYGITNSAQHIILGNFWTDPLLTPTLDLPKLEIGDDIKAYTDADKECKPITGEEKKSTDNKLDMVTFLKTRKGTTFLVDDLNNRFAIYNLDSKFTLMMDFNPDKSFFSIQCPGTMYFDADDITLHAKKKVEIVSDEEATLTSGKVEISAKDDVTVVSNNGNVNVKGKEIHLNEGNGTDVEDKDLKIDIYDILVGLKEGSDQINEANGLSYFCQVHLEFKKEGKDASLDYIVKRPHDKDGVEVHDLPKIPDDYESNVKYKCVGWTDDMSRSDDIGTRDRPKIDGIVSAQVSQDTESLEFKMMYDTEYLVQYVCDGVKVGEEWVADGAHPDGPTPPDQSMVVKKKKTGDPHEYMYVPLGSWSKDDSNENTIFLFDEGDDRDGLDPSSVTIDGPTVFYAKFIRCKSMQVVVHYPDNSGKHHETARDYFKVIDGEEFNVWVPAVPDRFYLTLVDDGAGGYKIADGADDGDVGNIQLDAADDVIFKDVRRMFTFDRWVSINNPGDNVMDKEKIYHYLMNSADCKEGGFNTNGVKLKEDETIHLFALYKFVAVYPVVFRVPDLDKVAQKLGTAFTTDKNSSTQQVAMLERSAYCKDQKTELAKIFPKKIPNSGNNIRELYAGNANLWKDVDIKFVSDVGDIKCPDLTTMKSTAKISGDLSIGDYECINGCYRVLKVSKVKRSDDGNGYVADSGTEEINFKHLIYRFRGWDVFLVEKSDAGLSYKHSSLDGVRDLRNGKYVAKYKEEGDANAAPDNNAPNARGEYYLAKSVLFSSDAPQGRIPEILFEKGANYVGVVFYARYNECILDSSAYVDMDEVDNTMNDRNDFISNKIKEAAAESRNKLLLKPQAGA